MAPFSFFFDSEDHELLRMLDEIHSKEKESKHLRILLDPYMHPRGIKELTSSRELRIAHAMIELLKSLEGGKAIERLQALRAVHNEVLANDQTAFKKNTARALLQIMKELVRSRDHQRRLELAHDFRSTLSGRPRVVRAMLKRYNLLEMPEEWNQIAFDDHVHDANTKGRKSPTHLIMDAWIKGIRSLTVIYYNHISPDAAREVLEAAEIMEVKVRIGVEFAPVLRDKRPHLIWIPRGFSDASDFVAFLNEPAIRELMTAGEQLSLRDAKKVLLALGDFNSNGRASLSARFGIDMDPLSSEEFQQFVGSGQLSLTHLAEFIFAKLHPLMEARVKLIEARVEGKGLDAAERAVLDRQAEEMNLLDPEEVSAKYLRLPDSTASTPSAVPVIEGAVDENSPWLLNCETVQLLNILRVMPAGFRLTLNISGLTMPDVLEMLFICKGDITHLELFNLKDFLLEPGRDLTEIQELRDALNSGHTIRLKKIVRTILARCEENPASSSPEQIETLRRILHYLPEFQSFYRGTPLGIRMGSDSTERSRRMHGMGFVVLETLPRRARAEVRKSLGSSRLILPAEMPVHKVLALIPRMASMSSARIALGAVSGLPLAGRLAFTHSKDWVEENKFRMTPKGSGNIATLGGFHPEKDNGLFRHEGSEGPASGGVRSVRYLNTHLSNVLKILLGFIPAFLTFWLTKDWWLLAYCGAFIWFGITAFRNVLQSVLGGGGVIRSPLLPWSEFVNWRRVSDSLMYTGFSVPLLDYLVKTVLLQQHFGVTAGSNPIILYSTMAVINGIYIASHNMFRGLPAGVAAGNFFRAVLSIPLAWIFNIAVGSILGVCGVPAPTDILQKWAAIISKTASDCVAGVIEGTGDRIRNVRLRVEDYGLKMAQLFDTYSKIELLFPDEDVLDLLESPKVFVKRVKSEARELEKAMIINALDLLYFWWMQPRALTALGMVMAEMSEEEKRIFVRSQMVLVREKEVSKLIIDGLIGKPFTSPLAFYLRGATAYLRRLNNFAGYAPLERRPAGDTNDDPSPEDLSPLDS